MSDANVVTEERSKGLWALCPACEHHWIVAHYPMDLAAFAAVAAQAACPKCGDTHPVVPRQSDGELLEEPVPVKPPRRKLGIVVPGTRSSPNIGDGS